MKSFKKKRLSIETKLKFKQIFYLNSSKRTKAVIIITLI